jgi:hypothetical protein
MADPSYIVDGVLTDGEAWVALASTTLDADTAYITFTNPDDGSSLDWSQFMDLVMICYIRSDDSGANERTCYLSLNGSSSNADYEVQQLKGNGTTASANLETSHVLFPVLIGDNSTANAFCAAIATFFDVNSGKFKAWVVQSASDYDGAGDVCLSAGTFLKQEPITSIKTWASSGGLKDESRIDLFGVLPRMVA